MKSRRSLFARWRECHWIARLSALGIFVAILLWQARYTVSVGNPMFGWPMPFDNLWYSGRGDRSYGILAANAIVWGALAASMALVVDRWARNEHKARFSLRGLFGLQTVAAVILVLGAAEFYLRRNPNNGSIFPKYAKVALGKAELWLDIGLFSDPLFEWPWLRLPVIFAIACLAFTSVELLSSRIGGRREQPLAARSAPAPEPAIAGFVERAIVALVLFFVFLWLTLPRIY